MKELLILLGDAISSGRPFYAFRLPHAADVTFVGSAREEAGLHEGGFALSTFNGSSRTLISDPCSHQRVAQEDIAPEPSTTRSQHKSGVEHIRETLIRLGEGKCVLSRLINGSLTKRPEEIFLDLAATRPDAFIFLFASPTCGYWLGATPETLLHCAEGALTTMSLAGTRPAHSCIDWDAKNIEEQKIVTDFIAGTLAEAGLSPAVSAPITRQAGPVEHLMTLVSAPLPETAMTGESIGRLLTALSPTPALGGYPRGTALSLIRHTEAHSRGAYGGLCGPIQDFSRFNFFVNLRSIRFFPAQNSFRQYVGGGITRFSDPDTEWAETRIKATSLPL